MLIQKQYNKLTLLEIWLEIQQCFSLSKKQKKKKKDFSQGTWRILSLCWKFEIWNVSTYTQLVLEHIPFMNKNLIILMMSAFFCKRISIFW